MEEAVGAVVAAVAAVVAAVGAVVAAVGSGGSGSRSGGSGSRSGGSGSRAVVAAVAADNHTSNNLDYDNSNNQKRLDKPVII